MSSRKQIRKPSERAYEKARQIYTEEWLDQFFEDNFDQIEQAAAADVIAITSPSIETYQAAKIETYRAKEALHKRARDADPTDDYDEEVGYALDDLVTKRITLEQITAVHNLLSHRMTIEQVAESMLRIYAGGIYRMM